jgi:hypothetical protein
MPNRSIAFKRSLVALALAASGAATWRVPNNPHGARALALAFDPFSPLRFWVGVEVGGVVGHSPSAARLTTVTPDPELAGGVLVGTETGEVWRVNQDARWTQLADGLPPVQALLAV